MYLEVNSEVFALASIENFSTLYANHMFELLAALLALIRISDGNTI